MTSLPLTTVPPKFSSMIDQAESRKEPFARCKKPPSRWASLCHVTDMPSCSCSRTEVQKSIGMAGNSHRRLPVSFPPPPHWLPPPCSFPCLVSASASLGLSARFSFVPASCIDLTLFCPTMCLGSRLRVCSPRVSDSHSQPSPWPRPVCYFPPHHSAPVQHMGCDIHPILTTLDSAVEPAANTQNPRSHPTDISPS